MKNSYILFKKMTYLLLLKESIDMRDNIKMHDVHSKVQLASQKSSYAGLTIFHGGHLEVSGVIPLGSHPSIAGPQDIGLACTYGGHLYSRPPGHGSSMYSYWPSL